MTKCLLLICKNRLLLLRKGALYVVYCAKRLIKLLRTIPDGLEPHPPYRGLGDGVLMALLQYWVLMAITTYTPNYPIWGGKGEGGKY